MTLASISAIESSCEKKDASKNGGGCDATRACLFLLALLLFGIVVVFLFFLIVFVIFVHGGVVLGDFALAFVGGRRVRRGGVVVSGGPAQSRSEWEINDASNTDEVAAGSVAAEDMVVEDKTRGCLATFGI
jgi:hypothetical protein